MQSRQGFTLVEMLVVIGIIITLLGASVGGYSAITKMAERSKARELVLNVATGLSAIYQQTGAWPRRIAEHGEPDGRLDAEVAPALNGYVSMNISSGKAAGLDRFGIVTPWATTVLKNKGASASASTVVLYSKDGPKSVDDHVLHYAVDLDGDGIVVASVGGETINVRASAIVWCAGKDGYMEPYTKGLRQDDIYSWDPGQKVN